MSRLWRTSLVVGVIALFSAPWALTELHGQGRTPNPRFYDPSTEFTVHGVVEAVEQGRSMTRGPGMSGSIHVVLKTDSGTLDIHLGPKRFLEEQHLSPTPGDRLQVIASRITVRGEKALVARIVKLGDTTYTLRDPQGIARWARSRRRGI